MPSLPNLDAPRQIAQSQQRIASYDSSQVARATAQLGQALGNVARAGDHVQEKEDKFAYAQARSFFLKEQVAAENELDNDRDYATYASRYTDRLNKARDEAVNMLRAPSDRALFQQDLDVDISRGLGSVQRKAKSIEIDSGRAQVLGLIDTNRESALTTPDEAARAAFIQSTEDAIEGARARGYLSDQEAVKWRQSATTDYALASVEMLDPQGRLEALDKPGLAQMIPADRRAQLKMQAQKQLDAERRQREIEARQMQAINRAELSSRVSDAQSAYLSGFDFENPPSASDFVASYGAEEGAERYAQFAKTQEVGTAIREAAMASPEERALLLDRFRPAKDGVAEDGFAVDSKLYGTLLNSAFRLGEELKNDPVTYVASRSPLLQEAAEAASTGDPAATEAYAAAMIAEQQRLGAPEPKLLTARQASDIAAAFSATEDGGSNAAQVIGQLQQQWGKNWPTVYKQLQGKLPGAALVIGSGVDDKTAATLARIAPLKTEELKRGLDSLDASDAKKALTEEMAEFRNTLAGQVGGERTFSTLYSEAERLAYAYMGQGNGSRDAVEMAKKALIDDKYTLQGTYRVPKAYDADLIEAGTERAIESLDPMTLNFRTPSGVPEDFAAGRVKAAIEKDGYWVTLPDESGVALYYGGEAVLDRAGNPVARKFDELAAEAIEKPSAWKRFNEGREKMNQSTAPSGAWGTQ